MHQVAVLSARDCAISGPALRRGTRVSRTPASAEQLRTSRRENTIYHHALLLHGGSGPSSLHKTEEQVGRWRPRCQASIAEEVQNDGTQCDGMSKGRTAIVLVLTLIPALVVWTWLLLVAAWSWCGLSGCSGGGFGVDTSGRPVAVAAFVLAGVAVALPVALVPWSGSRRRRLWVAAGVGLLAGAALVAIVLLDAASQRA